MRKAIDLESWDRLSVYNFFKDFALPVISITSEVDCTDAFKFCKENKVSFSKLSLFATLKAINSIKELRYRIEEKGADPVEYDIVNLLTPIRVDKNGKFVEIFVPYSSDFKTFYRSIDEKINSITDVEDSYAYIKNKPKDQAIATISCLPDLYFTSVTHTSQCDGTYPLNLILIGKVVERNGRLVMPVGISVHHGLTDGFHVSQFVNQLESNLKVVLETNLND